MFGGILIFFAVVLTDQLTKYLAETMLHSGHSVQVIPGLFDFTLVYNPGAAFGMFSGLPDLYRRVVLWAVSIIGVGVVVYFFAKETENDRTAALSLAAILGGAAGNIIDRFRYDSVVDFIDIYWKEHHWPAFNIADAAISIGVTIIMLRLVFEKREEKAQQSSESPKA